GHGWGGGGYGGSHSTGGGGGGRVGGIGSDPDRGGYQGGSGFGGRQRSDDFGGAGGGGAYGGAHGSASGGGLEPITETTEVGYAPGMTVTQEELDAGRAPLGDDGGRGIDYGGGPTFSSGGMSGTAHQWGGAHYDRTRTGD